MDCKNFEEVSQLYIDGELDTECVAQFEAHLFACEGCKRELEYLQATIRGIESYPQLEARPDLADNVMARIEGTASPWDFSQELGFIAGVLRDLSSGQLTRFPKAFAAMIVGLILLPPRIYLRASTITFQRIHAVLTPVMVRTRYLAKVQINQPIMNGLGRYAPLILKTSKENNDGYTKQSQIAEDSRF
jgi:hypothetical protein